MSKTKPVKITPNPGSAEARRYGCSCPVMDNQYGRGYHGDGRVFVYSGGCEMHQPIIKKEAKSASKKK